MSGATRESVPPPEVSELAAGGVPAGGLQAAPRVAPVPDSASQTRGRHMRELARNPWVLGITWTVAIVALIAAGTAAGIAAGAGAAAAVVLLAAIVVFAVASNRAAEDFFAAYADGRNLTRTAQRGSLPGATPLLRKGDRRYTDELFTGRLPGGLVGSLALWTYEETSTDSKGNRQTSYHRFTVVVAQLPETAAFIGELELQRRFGFRFLDGAEDVFRSRQRVELESADVDKKFEIFIGKGDDMNRARQVFSPSFVVWLCEEAHEKIAFELVAGALAVNAKGHYKTARELDSFCASAAHVARRLLDEAAE